MDTLSTVYSYVKLIGLPWKATEEEIAEFLDGCKLVGNVVIIKDERKRSSGDAVVKVDKADLEKALKYDRKHLGKRFVMVEEIDRTTYLNYLREMHIPNPKEDVFLKLSGLVWSASEEDIKNFLSDCEVKDVVITTGEDGKKSGNAFVHLDSLNDVKKALTHHCDYLGGRFVMIEEIEKSLFYHETKREEEIKEKKKMVNFKFCVKPKDTVDADSVLEECKDVVIDGVIWAMGNIKYFEDKKSEIELECLARLGIDARNIKNKLEELDNFVENVDIVENIGDDNTVVLNKSAFLGSFVHQISVTEEEK